MSQCRFHLHTIGCHPGFRELFPATSHCQQSHLLSKACFSSSAGSIYGSLPSTLSTPTAKAAWASSWRSVCQPEFAFHRLIHPDIASKYPRVGDRGGGGGLQIRGTLHPLRPVIEWLAVLAASSMAFRQGYSVAVAAQWSIRLIVHTATLSDH